VTINVDANKNSMLHTKTIYIAHKLPHICDKIHTTS